MLAGREAKAITRTDPLIRLGASTVCKTLSTSLIRKRESAREGENTENEGASETQRGGTGADSLSVMFVMLVIIEFGLTAVGI